MPETPSDSEILAVEAQLGITRAAHEARIRGLEQSNAVHTTQLHAHDRVLEKLADTLDGLVGRVDKFERRLLIAVLVIFAGTDNGAEILNKVVPFL
jgi:hypothetical protein